MYIAAPQQNLVLQDHHEIINSLNEYKYFNMYITQKDTIGEKITHRNTHSRKTNYQPTK